MNIVFDLGGVVFEWRPDTIASSVFESPDTQDLVKREIFRHPDWVSLDRGTLPLEEAIDRGAMRTGLPTEEIARLFNAVPPSLAPIKPTIELIHRLSNTSNKLFVLSNMHVASIAYLEQTYDFWGLFDGIVISCRLNHVKPEAQIYEHLLNEHRLDPAETIFIDDLEENLVAASALGIQTIRFVDSEQCEQALMRHRCL